MHTGYPAGVTGLPRGAGREMRSDAPPDTQPDGQTVLAEDRQVYSPEMKESRETRNVERVLEAAESASPVEAVEAVARELGSAFGAVAVSFLITDLSGRALVRLAHLPVSDSSATMLASLHGRAT